MRYAGIDKCDICNGNDVGVSVFVQGCHFHCKGCFNQETWDFNGGKEWNKKVEKQFIELISKPYIKRVSILGGEPLADENLDLTLRIVRIAKKYKPDINVWIYTGYTLKKKKNDFHDEIIKIRDSDTVSASLLDRIGIKRFHTVIMSQYLVDGQFEIEHQDLIYSKVRFAGSTNQRIIDVMATLDNKGEKIVLYE